MSSVWKRYPKAALKSDRGDADYNRVFSRPIALPVVTIETKGLPLISALDQAPAASPLARNNRKFLIFKYISKVYGVLASLRKLYQGKEDDPYNFFMFNPFSRTSCLTSYRGSKSALLHRVKERKTISSSN